MLLRRFLVVFAVILLFGACSGPQSSTDNTGPAPEEPTPEEQTRMSIAQYETFDVSTYALQLPEQRGAINHEVPSRLLQGRADEGVRQTVEGFRIQVFSAQDKEAAQNYRERVRQWWETVKGHAPEDLFKTQPPIVIEYSQPYYRVRFGAFAEREQAAEALQFVQEEYDGAFVAQGTVTVVR